MSLHSYFLAQQLNIIPLHCIDRIVSNPTRQVQFILALHKALILSYVNPLIAHTHVADAWILKHLYLG